MTDFQRAKRIREISFALEQIMTGFGYTTLEMPIIETAELFLTKAGDQIIEKLFTFERYGRQLSLRPEFTAAAAYHYATQTKETVARWQFHGAVFEDYTQNGTSDYQRYSIGAELIGSNSIAADIEIVLLALQGVISQNVNGWTLKVGHSGVIREALGRFNIDARTERFILTHRNLIQDGDVSAFRTLLDRYLPTKSELSLETDDESLTQMLLATLGNGQINNTMGGRTREDIATRILRKHKQVNEREQIDDVVDLITQWTKIHGQPASAFHELKQLLPDSTLLQQWENIISQLETYGIPLEQIEIHPDLVRNWDYYTGIVFEIVDREGNSLCGGGRYDELIGLISDRVSVPAVGFAYDATALADAIKQTANVSQRLFLHAQNADSSAIWQWLHLIRQHDIPVTLLMPEQNIDPNDLQLSIDLSGRVIFNKNSYETNDIEKLIAEIRKYDR
ncbi:MAG: ATP phosphoribosyltransferase regulatory subunit [Aggregatilineales bacterium]